jgi:hypothetical protein
MMEVLVKKSLSDGAVCDRRERFYKAVCIGKITGKPCDWKKTEKCMGVDTCIVRERFV